MNHERKLTGTIEPADGLDMAMRQSMFRLMSEFYHADETIFFRDLAEKNWVILLRDEAGKLQGFTSARIFDLNINQQALKILFSGDTIIHSDFWGTLELPRIWGRFMLNTLAEIGEQPLYWFLISSGFRTYRFLPAYFHDFFPRYDQATPTEMQQILDAAAKQLFGSKYDAKTGIIKLDSPTPLREGFSAKGEERSNNPHVNYFLSHNLGCVNGEELACITRLTTENIKPFVKRLLRN